MNCIVVDDDKLTHVLLEEFLQQIPEVNFLASFPNAIEAIKFINKNAVDLVFLDIHMPDFTGFDFIQTLAKPPFVVITTSDKNLALTAFEYDCIIDYITKPIAKERLVKSVNKARTLKLQPVTNQPTLESTQAKEEGDPKQEEIYVNIDRRLVKITVENIRFIEASGDYIKIYTTDKKHVVHTTLKKIEDKLPDSLFLKVHRSYVINTKAIVDIEDNSVVIDQSVIPVSRANRAELIKRLNLL